MTGSMPILTSANWEESLLARAHLVVSGGLKPTQTDQTRLCQDRG